MRSTKLSLCICVALGGVPPVLAHAQAPAITSASTSAARATKTTLQTIIVTAQRKSENLQDVPVAVTVLDAATLQRTHTDNIADLNSMAPNFIIRRQPGSSQSAAVSIRGVTTVNPGLYWSPPVAIYLDGVYVGKTQGSLFDLPAIERIEILNGPQGTLFGRNSMAGAINIVTPTPSGTFNGYASVSTGRFASHTAKMMLDLPGFGPFRILAAGRIDRGDGWVNTSPDASVPTLNNQHSQQAFVDALFQPNERFDLHYRLDQSVSRTYGDWLQTTNSDIGDLFGISGITTSPTRQTYAAIDSPSAENVTTTGNAITASWHVSENQTIKYIGAHREAHYDELYDLDGSSVDIAQMSRLSRYRQTSHELQYFSKTDSFDWILGAYYFRDRGTTAEPQSYFFGSVAFPIDNFSVSAKSKALYGQLTYHLTDAISIAGGIRRTVENDAITRELKGPGASIPNGTGSTASFGGTTPTFDVQYRISSSHMLYARYAKGFQSGGFNGEAQTVQDTVTPFGPETQKSFEFGSKNILMENRLRINADAFFNILNGLQEAVFTAQGSAASNIRNVGKAHSYGMEAQLEWQPNDRLRISANYGILREHYKTFMELGQNVAANRAVVFAPRNTASILTHAILAKTTHGVVELNASLQHTSSYYMYPYQLQLVDPNSQLAANTKMPALTLANATLGVMSIPLTNALSGDLELWVRNIFNADKMQSSIDFGPGFGNLRVSSFTPPRTFGITGTLRW